LSFDRRREEIQIIIHSLDILHCTFLEYDQYDVSDLAKDSNGAVTFTSLSTLSPKIYFLLQDDVKNCSPIRIMAQ
jgi:hypothetical protein